MLKIKLTRDYFECKAFQAIVTKYRIEVIPLFVSSKRKFRIATEVTEEIKKEIYDCMDLFDFIEQNNLEVDDEPV